MFCYQCKLAKFICYTPSGADYCTCPLCDKGTISLDIESDKNIEYCFDCKIIYKLVSDTVKAAGVANGYNDGIIKLSIL